MSIRLGGPGSAQQIHPFGDVRVSDRATWRAFAAAFNEHEQPRGVFHAAERWRVSDRTAKCMLPSGVHAITDEGVVSVESERPSQLGMLVFAVRLVSLAREFIQAARIIGREQSDARIATVGVDSEVQGTRHQTLVMLDEHAAEEFVQAIGTLPR